MSAMKRILCALAAMLALALGDAARADEAPIQLRVMTFNIWYGGEQVSFAQVVEAIRAAKADVVGLQEPDGRIHLLADALGWYADERLHVISRFPLFGSPDGENLYGFVEPRPGRVVAIANVHLPATPDGPEDVRDGKTADEVLTLEKEARLPAIEPYVAVLPKLVSAGTPVFLTGDFNAPSHLDWTAATQAARPQVRYPLEWPVSKALDDAGLRDSYREAHPDPVAIPGLTWTPGTPYPLVKQNETFDRIDRVWSAGQVTTLESHVVGEPGGPNVDMSVDPWPSDHRAVVSVFNVVPAAAPAMVAVDKRVMSAGDNFLVRFTLAGAEDGRIAIVPRGGKPEKDTVVSIPTGDGSDRPSIRIGSSMLRPGAYVALLLDPEGKERARTPFWVMARDALPELRLNKARYRAGEPISVSWLNAPGNRLDWLGIYKAGDPDLYNYAGYVYTGAAVEGKTVIDEAALGGPLAPGDYELRLMRDDAYVLLAKTTFKVTK
jgi:endonuclease/exonuclease/phosphatase family metal-dependent hydrolase